MELRDLDTLCVRDPRPPLYSWGVVLAGFITVLIAFTPPGVQGVKKDVGIDVVEVVLWTSKS